MKEPADKMHIYSPRPLADGRHYFLINRWGHQFVFTNEGGVIMRHCFDTGETVIKGYSLWYIEKFLSHIALDMKKITYDTYIAFEDPNAYGIFWEVGDIRDLELQYRIDNGVAKDVTPMTNDELRNVLIDACYNADASCGVSWDSFLPAIEDYYEEL